MACEQVHEVVWQAQRCSWNREPSLKWSGLRGVMYAVVWGVGTCSFSRDMSCVGGFVEVVGGLGMLGGHSFDCMIPMAR